MGLEYMLRLEVPEGPKNGKGGGTNTNCAPSFDIGYDFGSILYDDFTCGLAA